MPIPLIHILPFHVLEKIRRELEIMKEIGDDKAEEILKEIEEEMKNREEGQKCGGGKKQEGD